jgi:hypothetical protein
MINIHDLNSIPSCGGGKKPKIRATDNQQDMSGVWMINIYYINSLNLLCALIDYSPYE